jgi:hypothetical protein
MTFVAALSSGRSAVVSAEPKLEPRCAHPEAFLHDCDSENTYLHVHVDLMHAARKASDVATLLRDGFQRLATQLHLRAVQGKGKDRHATRPSYACADAQARKVLFGGAVLQATQTMELWQRYSSEPGVLGVRLHFHHPNMSAADASTTDALVGVKKRERFVRLFNAAWVKLLDAHNLLKHSPLGFDVENDPVIESQQTDKCLYNHTEAFSKKRGRDLCDDDTSSCDSSSEEEESDDSEGEWATPADCDSGDECMSASSGGAVAFGVFGGGHVPMPASAQPKRSALKQANAATFSSTDMRRSVSFAPTRTVVSVPFSLDERVARMGVGITATFGNGFMKPLRSVRTGDAVWLDTELDCRGKRVRVSC